MAKARLLLPLLFLLNLLVSCPALAQGTLVYHYGEDKTTPAAEPTGQSQRNETLRAGINQAFGRRESGIIGGQIGISIPDPGVSASRVQQEALRSASLAARWEELERVTPLTPEAYLDRHYQRKRLDSLLKYQNDRNPDHLRRWMSSSPDFKHRAGSTLFDIRSAQIATPQRASLQQTGEEAIALSDQAFAGGQNDSASFYYSIARASADILVGIDPVTGTLRAVYESIVGVNLITDEPLNDIDRGVAIFSVATLGFGGGISKGIKLFNVLMTNVIKDTRLVKTVISSARHVARRFAAFRGNRNKNVSEVTYIGMLVEASDGPRKRVDTLVRRATQHGQDPLHQSVERGANRIHPELYALDDKFVQNITLGSATEAQIHAVGLAFVGENARRTGFRQNKSFAIFISADERRVYRSPFSKESLGGQRQANLEIYAPPPKKELGGPGQANPPDVRRKLPLSDAHINLIP